MELTLVTVGLNVLGALVKKFVPEKWRGQTIHAALFVGAILYLFFQHPELRGGDMVQNGIILMGMAVASYEVLLKRIGNQIPTFGKIFIQK